jgi:2-polyprenyl-3-methyl-5-hydroxy-6-metoxy-1,4-benzoquinol methylase
MLEERAKSPELLDGPDFGPEQVASTFRFLIPINFVFGGIRPALSFFRRESTHWDRNRTYRILDAGCGVGDVAAALVRWARRSGFSLDVHGVDLHPLIVDMARDRCAAYPEITFTCEDVLQMEGVAYDYVHASQFVHHFPDEEVLPLLKHFLSLCGQKVVINDLQREPLHYLGTWIITLFASATSRHDARLSVAKGFKLDEVRALLKAGGLDTFELESHFLYRFLLILDKAAYPGA